MISKYYIIRPLERDDENYTIVNVGTAKYVSFEVINDKGEVVDIYDNIHIDNKIRVDILLYKGKWCTRFFSASYKTDLLDYDLSYHTIKEYNEDNE